MLLFLELRKLNYQMQYSLLYVNQIYTQTAPFFSSVRSCYILSPCSGFIIKEKLSYSFYRVAFTKFFAQFLCKVRLYNSYYLVISDSVK